MLLLHSFFLSLPFISIIETRQYEIFSFILLIYKKYFKVGTHFILISRKYIFFLNPVLFTNILYLKSIRILFYCEFFQKKKQSLFSRTYIFHYNRVVCFLEHSLPTQQGQQIVASRNRTSFGSRYFTFALLRIHTALYNVYVSQRKSNAQGYRKEQKRYNASKRLYMYNVHPIRIGNVRVKLCKCLNRIHEKKLKKKKNCTTFSFVLHPLTT